MMAISIYMDYMLAMVDGEGVTSHMQCMGTAKRSGKRCVRPACVGMHVCERHGGATTLAKVAAHKYKVLQAAIMHGDRRPAWEVLSDAMHVADSLLQDAAHDVLYPENGEVNADDVVKLIQSVERAAKMGSILLRTKAYEHMARRVGLDGQAIAEIMGEAIAAAGLGEEAEIAIKTALVAGLHKRSMMERQAQGEAKVIEMMSSDEDMDREE